MKVVPSASTLASEVIQSTTPTTTAITTESAVEQITEKLVAINLPTPVTTTTTTTTTTQNKPTKPTKPTKVDGKTDDKSEKKVDKKVEKKGGVVEATKVEVEANTGKKVDLSQPPTVPVLPPLYTTPAPSTTTTKKVNEIRNIYIHTYIHTYIHNKTIQSVDVLFVCF